MKRKYNYNIALVLGMLVGFWAYMTASSKERCSVFFNSAGSTTSAIASHRSMTKRIHYTKGLSILAKLQCIWIVASATSLSLTSKIALQWILAQLAAQGSNLVLLDCGNWEHIAHQSNKWMYYNREKALSNILFFSFFSNPFLPITLASQSRRYPKNSSSNHWNGKMQ